MFVIRNTSLEACMQRCFRLLDALKIGYTHRIGGTIHFRLQTYVHFMGKESQSLMIEKINFYPSVTEVIQTSSLDKFVALGSLPSVAH